MTSSLVGSEMCIRDSWCCLELWLSPRLFVIFGGCFRARTRPMPPPPEGCLLYTSDAADDM
eukprot:5332899-Prorocentrum_lima.AAC.1